MAYKLTLNISKELSEQAKEYAKSQGRSLSDLVESYFKAITSGQEEQDLKVSSKVKSMKGMMKVPPGYDHKAELKKELSKKYLK